MRHQLIAFLGGGIKEMGWSTCWSSVKVSRRLVRIHSNCWQKQMFDVAIPAAFQQVGKAHKVALHIRIRVFNAVTHAGLCRKIDHDLRLMHFENRLQCLLVFKMQVVKR